MADTPVLAMRGISKSYFGSRVLVDVDLSLRAGEIHALLGENGAGKSTLMNILFGMPVIQETGGFTGDIEIEGSTTSISSPKAAMGLGIGMVHQEFMLLPGFAVYENIKLNRENLRTTRLGKVLGSRLATLDVPTMRRDSESALHAIDLDVSVDMPVGALPVGHMQFIEIAREVDKTGLKVLVFDEPTAVLTETEAEQLLSVMRKLADDGVAILFITHRLGEVMKVADVVTILRDGRRVACTTRAETSVEVIAEKMVGREVISDFSDEGERSVSDEVLLSLRGLHVSMSGEEVHGVDLDIRRGEILGLGGLAGQGKIGIANGIMGLYPATGEVTLEGQKLPLNSPKEVLRAGLAFVSEDRRGVGLLLDESVEMNIAIPAIEVRGRFLRMRFLGKFAPVDGPAVRVQAEASIEQLDIRTTGPRQTVRRLSGGNQQKVCLARALVLDPGLLLVSEPTRGIDVGAKQLVLDWLVRLNRETGLTILITSSELGELRSVCDRVGIVFGGRIAGILSPDAPDVEFGLLLSGEAV